MVYEGGTGRVLLVSPALPLAESRLPQAPPSVDGVTQGLLGYASKDAGGRLKLEKFKESLLDAAVEISDDVFVLKADEAQRLREPPTSGKSGRSGPSTLSSSPGGAGGFHLLGTRPVRPSLGGPWRHLVRERREHHARGRLHGKRDRRPSTPFVHTAGQREFIAEVRIHDRRAAARRSGWRESPGEPGRRVIRWRGNVPPQKWTELLHEGADALFAASPELKLEVSFEVGIDREQAQSKLDETRSGLKELGLNDTASLS